MCVFFCFVCFSFFFVCSMFLNCFMYCFSPSIWLFISICVQFYRPLRLGLDPIAVNKYHIICGLLLIALDFLLFCYLPDLIYRSQWPCGQRRRSETAWLLESRFWIPLRAWNVCLLCLLCDLSLPGVPVCMWSRNLNTRRPRPELGFYAKEKNIILINDKQIKKNVEESGRGLF